MTKRAMSRAAYTKEDLEKMTAHELGSKKLTTVEESLVREIMQERARQRAERERLERIEEQPILADLRKVGWDVDTVWRLVNSPGPYPEAIPVLLKHLMMPYSEIMRDGLARALAVPDARFAFPLFVEEYKKAPPTSGPALHDERLSYQYLGKHGLACAVAATVTRETLDELIALAKNQDHGLTRIYLIQPLKRRSNDPRAKAALHDLVDDPDLKVEIAAWLKDREKRSRKKAQRG